MIQIIEMKNEMEIRIFHPVLVSGSKNMSTCLPKTNRKAKLINEFFPGHYYTKIWYTIT